MNTMKLDIHAKLMKNYKQVPQWWFLVLLAGSIGLSLLMSFVWKEEVQLPWWGMLFAFGLAWIVTLPIGIIQATTNQVADSNNSSTRVCYGKLHSSLQMQYWPNNQVLVKL